MRFWGAVGDGVTDDTAAFITALTHTNRLTISTPGTYMLSAPIYLNSNQSVIGSSGVILKKRIAYSHVFANAAAKTTGATPDSNISISNLTIDCNNITSTQTGGASKTAVGHIQMTYIDGVILSNITYVNGDANFMGIHLQSATNVSITNYSYTGLKDAVHINGGCHFVTIDGFYIDNHDDAFGIMTDDYPSIQHNCQDLSDIVVKNGVSHATSPGGYIARFMTGSWLDWGNGNSYTIGNVARNAGNLYKKANSGSAVGSVAPTHSSGDVTGADGITWRWVGAGSNYNSNIYNITFQNVQVLDTRVVIRLTNNDAFDQGEYPGTLNTSIVDGVYYQNVTSVTTPFFLINNGLTAHYGVAL